MIDFHTHILPGIDDGSRDVEESLAMLREEARQGVQGVILTPHFYAGEQSIERFLRRRQRAWQQLLPYLDASLPPVCLGAEVQYFEGICQVEGLSSLSLNGSALLMVEMPFSKWTQRTVSDILELNSRQNMKVVLAHIDRYLGMQPASLWQRLYAGGVLMQVNTSFFQSWTTKRKALRMLADGRIHFIGSDCHSMKSRVPDCGQVIRLLQEQKYAGFLEELQVREYAYLGGSDAVVQ